MLTNAELLQRLRSLSEQVPEGEWVRWIWNLYKIDGGWKPMRRDGAFHRDVDSITEVDLACTLRNALPQILEALEQVERQRESDDRAEKAIALSDMGSAEHKAEFDPDGVGEIPAGWRVVERIREVLIDGV